MCGITGCLSLTTSKISNINKYLNAMSNLIAHRGPDGKGEWTSNEQSVGLVHRRLSIIDLSEAGSQPMSAQNGTVIVFKR